MITVLNIYPYVKRSFPHSVPDVKVNEVPFVLLGELAECAINQDGTLKQEGVALIERFLTEGNEHVKYLAFYGFLERLYQCALSRKIAPETIEAGLGPNSAVYWRTLIEMWETMVLETVEAKLVRERGPHSELPADLSVLVKNTAGETVECYRDVWYEDLPFYQQFCKQRAGTYSSDQKHSRCPKCRMTTVKSSFKEIYIGCTDTSNLSDRSEYYQFRTYTCSSCRLGWSEFIRKRTWVEVSYP